MDNKIDLNDLLREKRELDSFLSTIAKDQASPSVPVKETVQTKESSSPSVLENKSVLTDSDRAAAGLTIEKPGIMPEDLSGRLPVRINRIPRASMHSFPERMMLFR